MSRIAKCSCGALSVTVTGEPESVVACHCIECQRRTGSVFGIGAYYSEANIAVTGTPKTYTRATDAGFEFVTRFCAVCGTSLFWTSGKNPGRVGVAVGAFEDPSFTPPDALGVGALDASVGADPDRTPLREGQNVKVFNIGARPGQTPLLNTYAGSVSGRLRRR
jgi:hypothetical protein